MNWIKNHLIVFLSITILLIFGCFEPVEVPEADAPPTEGSEAEIDLDGRHQNPAWSSDGIQMVFILYHNGYGDGLLNHPEDTIMNYHKTNEMKGGAYVYQRMEIGNLDVCELISALFSENLFKQKRRKQ